MKILFLMALTAYIMAAMKYSYYRGQQDANFDREAANVKLQQCNNIIRGVK